MSNGRAKSLFQNFIQLIRYIKGKEVISSKGNGYQRGNNFPVEHGGKGKYFPFSFESLFLEIVHGIRVNNGELAREKK